MAETELHPFNEAGRRLKAAVISYLLGYKGVDRTLQDLPEEVDEWWAQLAEQLAVAVQRQGLDPETELHRGPIRIK